MMRTLNLDNLTIKRPEKEDLPDLLPVIAAFAVWFAFTDRSIRTGKTMLIPAAVGLAAWVYLKGLRYVPR